MTQRKYTIASLFCGAGGLDLGFHMSGRFKTIWANDMNSDATETMKLWCKDARIVCGDITKIPNLMIPKADIVLGGFPCFTAGELVRTNRGLIPIEDVNLEDEVLTHNNRYKPVLNLMRKYKEGIYRLKVQGVLDLHVTEEHPFYVRSVTRKYVKATDTEPRTQKRIFSEPYWKETKELKKDDYIGVAINNLESNELNLTPELCWLLGRYVADGSINRVRRKYSNSVVFVIGDTKVDDFLEHTFIHDVKCYPSDGSKSTVCCITDERLSLLCQKFGFKATSKFLPKFILDLPKDLLETFMDGYLSGDGCFSKNKWHFKTSSIRLAYDLIYCIAKVYHTPCSIYYANRKGKATICSKEVNVNDSWCVEFNKYETKGTRAVFIDGMMWYPVRELEYIDDFKGWVYNLEVLEDNSYTVNNLIVHNCQGFSVAGKMVIDDPRNKLYREYVRVLKRVQPYVFIGENVEGLLMMENGAVIDQIAKDFSEVGYNIHYDLIDAVDYGVPQNRKRVIIVGVRKGIEDFKMPIPKKCEHKTMRDVLWGLPKPTEDEVHQGGYSPRYMTSNRYRDWDKPSYTIIAGGRNTPLHPSSCPMVLVGKRDWQFGSIESTRRMSYKECAILQSFPSDMKFMGNLESKYKQIGNAVPPLLGLAYAKEIVKELDKLDISSLNGF